MAHHPTNARVLLFFPIAMLACGCFGDASHTNPLDPLSDNFSETGRLEGRVADRALMPIADATVELFPDNILTSTTADGGFSFSDVPAGFYEIRVRKDGYALASDTVTVRFAKSVERQMALNALPLIESIRLNTVHISRWWPTDDLFILDATVIARDPDGPFDLSAVWITTVDGSFSDTLESTTTVGQYRSAIPQAQLPAGSLQTLLGNLVEVRASDGAGDVVVAGPLALARIIEPTPVADSPKGLETVGNMPTLTWLPANLDYPYTHRVDITRVDDDIETQVASFGGITSDETQIVVPTALDIGTYFWTVWVEDQFGNRSRSKEAGFAVQ